ncbi:MAG TPA: nitroreductase [Firmicutes bacterium]|nr:nitroreductase [Bacillota bacterium]
MDVKEAIEKRRTYRSLDSIEITDEIVAELGEAARLMPSCFNNQPWRFVFVKGSGKLKELKQAFNKGNEWANDASMIIAVFAKKDDDCIVKEREYYLFDTGMACGSILLRAVELGLAAHPIAGFSPEAAKDILGIPEEANLITLIIVGKKSEKINPALNENQAAQEKTRPPRRPVDQIYSIDVFTNELFAENIKGKTA